MMNLLFKLFSTTEKYKCEECWENNYTKPSQNLLQKLFKHMAIVCLFFGTRLGTCQKLPQGERGVERGRILIFSALHKGGSLKTEPLKREGHKNLSHNFHKGGS